MRLVTVIEGTSFMILQEINRKVTIILLLVEQNSKQALEFIYRDYILVSGKIVKSESIECLLNDDFIKKVFLC